MSKIKNSHKQVHSKTIGSFDRRRPAIVSVSRTVRRIFSPSLSTRGKRRRYRGRPISSSAARRTAAVVLRRWEQKRRLVLMTEERYNKYVYAIVRRSHDKKIIYCTVLVSRCDVIERRKKLLLPSPDRIRSIRRSGRDTYFNIVRVQHAFADFHRPNTTSYRFRHVKHENFA